MAGKCNDGGGPGSRDVVRCSASAGRLGRLAIAFMAAAVIGIVVTVTFGPPFSGSPAAISSCAWSGNDAALEPAASHCAVQTAAPPDSSGYPGSYSSGPGSVGGIVLAAAEPEQSEKLDNWREEGLRMASELTGIPEAFFRWLQDKGVPVGEFMRFLMPFLEWIEMVDPHNGTKPSPQPKNQPRQTTV